MHNGVDYVVIACNTLHKFLNFEMNPRLKFIHLIKETGDYLKTKMIGHTLVICTDASVNSKLHQMCFACRYPDKVLQQNCQELIGRILAGEHKEEDAFELAKQLNQYAANQNAAVIGLALGCTEFSQFNEQYPLRHCGLSPKFEIVDPTAIVVDKLCEILMAVK